MEGGVVDGFSWDVPRTVTPGTAVGVARLPRCRMWDSSRADNSLNEVRRGLLFLGTQSRVVCVWLWVSYSSVAGSKQHAALFVRAGGAAVFSLASSRACALAASCGIWEWVYF